MKSKSGIYIIKNITQKKYYVGQCMDFEKRKNDHFKDLKKGTHINKKMQADYTKGDQFIFFVCWYCPNNHNLLMSEESRLVGKLLDNGYFVYNGMPTKYYLKYRSREWLMIDICDYYCRENFGKTFAQMTLGKSPARFEMIYQLMVSPKEDHEKICNSFQEVSWYYSDLRKKGVKY